MVPITQQCFNAAVKSLRKCITKLGLYASGTPAGYTSVWSRDANIALLGGACYDSNKHPEQARRAEKQQYFFKSVFRKTIDTLVKNQAADGQIANAIGLYDPLKHSDVTYNTIDSSLWFIIGTYVYEKSYKTALPKKIREAREKAFVWVTYQDVSEEHLPLNFRQQTGKTPSRINMATLSIRRACTTPP